MTAWDEPTLGGVSFPVGARVAPVDLQRLQSALKNKGIVCSTEAEFSRAVAGLLSEAGIQFHGEVKLSDKDRIDFMVDGFGLELKIKGTIAGVLRQLKRYAQSEKVEHLVTVTTSAKLANGLPTIIGGKNHTAIHMGAW